MGCCKRFSSFATALLEKICVINMETEWPKRKHPRLPCDNYRTKGAYFVTICTQNRRCLLSKIASGLASAKIEYSAYGRIAEQELSMLEKRYPFIHVDRYVIMPNHIHIIFVFDDVSAEQTAFTSKYKNDRCPTLMDIVCTYKSMTTKRCKELRQIEKLFQTSFYEHIIRDREDYEEHVKYICENPVRWYYDELYSEK